METDELSHLYTFIVHPDMTFEFYLDDSESGKGKLTEDWDFLPEKEIKDPAAKKPADWVDEAKIPDPDDKKPEGYDDIPQYIPDPNAKKPEDWNEEEDGEWEPPQIENPEYKGEWKPKMIDNPDYKGPWVHPMIPNPEYKDDPLLYVHKMGGIGIEIWQVKAGTMYDNIFVGDDKAEYEDFISKTWKANKD